MSRKPDDKHQAASQDKDPQSDPDVPGNQRDGAPDPATGDAAEALRRLQQERDELFERLAHATADFKNAQRRLTADKEQAVQYANSQLIKSLLPVIDSFERAISVDPAKADVPSILKGMEIVHDQWMKVLESQDVQIISPQVGDPFDPAHHQALMQQPSDRYTEPTIMQVFQKGYLLHGRTLRPAQVAVSKVQ